MVVSSRLVKITNMDETNNSSKKIIVVLGMHRSGTSALTRGLQTLGVDLGDRLMPPLAENNEKGFWEDLDINALNLEMLDFLNKDWHFLSPIQLSDVDILCKNGYETRALELLRKKTSNTEIFGFKDPRVTKLLPFWMVVFRKSELDVNYIITLRHPLSVCKYLWLSATALTLRRGPFCGWSMYSVALQKRLEKTVLSLTMIA